MTLFFGEGYKAQYALIAYRFLITRQPVSAQDIVWEYYKNIPKNKRPQFYTQAEGYGELKKALPEVIKAIREKEGLDSILEEGNNRKKIFRYVGENDNPLADLIHLRTIISIKEFWEFCRNSSGFIPEQWFEYFFKDTSQLYELRKTTKEGGQYISSDINRGLKNIEFLPFLYEAIHAKKILRIKYFFSDSEELIFHPHLLKEYNGRWFLFGHAEGHNPEFGYNLALDRLLEKPEIARDATLKFKNPPKDFYQNFFKDIVGVTHDDKWLEVEEIKIRARNYRMFNLINTKPFHRSQKVIKEYDKEAKYGEFKVVVKINNEFIGRILQLGAGIEIMSPPHVRELVKERISNMMAIYNQDQTEQ